jgi:O-antigen ligase
MSRFYPAGVPDSEKPKQNSRPAISAPISMPAGLAPRIETDHIGLTATLLGMYLFMHVAPFAEIAAVYLHNHLPIVASMCALITVLAAFTLRLQRFFESQIAIPWMALLVMLILASLFGLYPRFSLSFILGYAGRFHIMPMLICAIAITTRQVRHILFWMMGAHLLTLVVCWRYGQVEDGRFAVMGFDYENPNDLAMFLIFGFCLVLFLLFLNSKAAKFWGLIILAISAVYIVRTGSRAALLCLATMALALFIYAPGRVRIALLASGPVLLTLVSLTVPFDTWKRISMIAVNPEAEYATTADENLRRALESQMARVNLQKRAIELTKQHPLLGVGPQMFADAVDALSRAQTGTKSSWQGTHDVYLQVASEAGIPALIFYIASIVMCVTCNYRCIKLCRGMPEHRQKQAQSFCIMLTILAYAVGTFFCNFTYQSHMSMLVGLTVANALAIKKEVGVRSDQVLAQAFTPPAYIPRPAVARG